MNIVFLTRLFYPYIGGVEKHVLFISKELAKKGHKITVITEKYDNKLLSEDKINDIKILRFSYPKIKFLGLFTIWLKLLKYFPTFLKADIIHIHDVFIWYLPFRLFLFFKPVYSTFHGWEGVYPIPLKNKLIRKLSAHLSHKSICIGKYIPKYYGIKADKIIYGGVEKMLQQKFKKQKNLVVFLGRLEKDTGLLQFINWIKKNKGKYKIVFCGDGYLRKKAQKYGDVKGIVKNPSKYLEKTQFCCPGGYLSACEALNYGCKLLLFYHNPLKKDYWKLSPFFKIKNNPEKAKNWLQKNTWRKIAEVYLDLWKN